MTYLFVNLNPHNNKIYLQSCRSDVQLQGRLRRLRRLRNYATYYLHHVDNVQSSDVGYVNVLYRIVL